MTLDNEKENETLFDMIVSLAGAADTLSFFLLITMQWELKPSMCPRPAHKHEPHIRMHFHLLYLQLSATLNAFDDNL